jgi:hypothetical protein
VPDAWADQSEIALEAVGVLAGSSILGTGLLAALVAAPRAPVSRGWVRAERHAMPGGTCPIAIG